MSESNISESLFSKKHYKVEKVLYDGKTYHIRPPSAAEKQTAGEKAKLNTKNPQGVAFDIWLMIYCVYTPEGKRVFRESQFQELYNLPHTEYMDLFVKTILKLMFGEDNVEEKKTSLSNTDMSG